MQKILIMFFVFVPSLCVAQDATITQSAQRSIEAAQFNLNLAILFILLSILANKIMAVANYLILTQPEIHPFQLPMILFPKKGDVLFTVLNNEGNPAALVSVNVIDKADKILERKFTNLRGIAKIKTPANCAVIINGFGFAKRIIPPEQIAPQNRVILQATDDISLDTVNLHSKIYARWILIIASIVGIYLTMSISNYYPASVTFFIILITLCNILVILRNPPATIKILDRHNNLLKNKLIKIKNADGEKIKEIRTDQAGRVRFIATPSFYKISSANSLGATFTIRTQRPLSAHLKLN